MSVKPAYALNGQPCSREAFYAAACHPAQHIVVQACAGAGKTWMLVSRIIRALLAGSAPSEILAITFTRKAAAEMHERLQTWLREFSCMSEEQLTQELLSRGFTEQEISKKHSPPSISLHSLLSNLYQTTLQNPQQVQIRTFHSWFSALLANSPISVLEALGLPAQYELLESDEKAVELAWPRFYELLQNDQTLHSCYRAAVADTGRWGVQDALANALDKRVEFEIADAAGVLGGSIRSWQAVYPVHAHLSEPLQILEQSSQALLDAAKLLAAASQATYAAKGVELLDAVQAQQWFAVPRCLLTLKDEPRKFSDKLKGIDHIRAMQELCVQVQAMLAQHAAYLHHSRMTELTRALIRCFKQTKLAHSWVDMGDLERAALHLLRDSQLSGWVQQRLDAQIKHLLIDEFQDTNPLQWQALQSWLASYSGAGANPPAVFLVGDAKQSIYRFRRAEPQVFEAATRFVCEGLGGTLLACDHTRRNAQAVVDVVNAVLGQAVQAEGYHYRTHSTESDLPGKVVRLPLAPKPEKVLAGDELLWRDTLTTPRDTPEEKAVDTECELAARWVAAEVSRACPAGEIMVLARKRDRLSRMRDALRQQGIASSITEKAALIELPEVQDVVALLDVLVSPGNDLALAQALKSPLLAWRDQDLIELALRVKNSGAPWLATLLRTLQKQEQTIELNQRRQADLPDFEDLAYQTALKLQRWQQLLALLPAHDALSHIYADEQLVAKFLAASPAGLRSRVQASLEALLQHALSSNAGRFLTPHAWVRSLKSSHTPAPSVVVKDAVQLMTVHGAKGLEARTVLLIDTHTTAERVKARDVLVDWPGESPAPQVFAFLRSEAAAPSCVAQALAHEKHQRGTEEINALYVAMTRAKEQLVFSGHEVRTPDARCAWLRLQAVAGAQPELVEETLPTDFKRTGAAAPEAVPAAYIDVPVFNRAEYADFGLKPLDAADFINKFAINNIANTAFLGTEASRTGQAMHRLLELYAPGVELSAYALSVQQQFALEPVHMQQALQRAERITQGEAAWLWDEAQLSWQGNEVEISDEGQLMRIDRVVRRLDTGAWWVVDYKSAAQPERQQALQEQLQRYVHAVEKAYPGVPVRGALLSGEGRLICL
jgi:ATP-dependent helicase/nuclease subunit A